MLIIFTSDNGGLQVDKNTKKAGHDVAGGFNGSKNSPLDGGHRTPLFAVWKNYISPDVTHEPAINQDMPAPSPPLSEPKSPPTKHKTPSTSSLYSLEKEPSPNDHG